MSFGVLVVDLLAFEVYSDVTILMSPNCKCHMTFDIVTFKSYSRSLTLVSALNTVQREENDLLQLRPLLLGHMISISVLFARNVVAEKQPDIQICSKKISI